MSWRISYLPCSSCTEHPCPLSHWPPLMLVMLNSMVVRAAVDTMSHNWIVNGVKGWVRRHCLMLSNFWWKMMWIFQPFLSMCLLNYHLYSERYYSGRGKSRLFLLVILQIYNMWATLLVYCITQNSWPKRNFILHDFIVLELCMRINHVMMIFSNLFVRYLCCEKNTSVTLQVF